MLEYDRFVTFEKCRRKLSFKGFDFFPECSLVAEKAFIHLPDRLHLHQKLSFVAGSSTLTGVIVQLFISAV